MPIYAYRCDACGFRKDVLQKMSDPPLAVCPSCGAEAFAKQLSAPAFQLKGTGWYVTDFRDKGARKPEGAEAGAAEAGGGGDGDAVKASGNGSDKAPVNGAQGKGTDGKGSDGKANGAAGNGAAAPAAAATPAAKPAAKPGGSTGTTGTTGGGSGAS